MDEMKIALNKLVESFHAPIENAITRSFSDVVIGKESQVFRHLFETIVTKYRLFGKRIFDLLFSFIFIVIGLPFFIIIIVAIRLTSRGPAFFAQERVGYQGKVFRIFKFRTMRQDNSDQDHIQYVQSLLKEDTHEPNSTDLVEKYIEYLDKRTTKVGKFLRATSLDELPQLVNILLGQMSLVGPRPHPVYEVNSYKKWYNRRHTVKPGLTGWSKLNLRLTPQNYEEAILYDLWYVDHWSLSLDLRILFMTLPVVLAMRDAH